MNKTININLAGIIFHIDEVAFNRLNSYLNSIKAYFSNQEGSDEIMSDIESRIAELFNERIADNKQVITLTDVEAVIGVMGQPEDYAGEDEREPYAEPVSGASSGGRKRRRRIFRHPDEKVLGGVCGGLAAYLNIDPIWLRLLWILSVFVYGGGVIFYLILWIIIPEASTTAEKLEMKGEDVTISNIEKSIKEEVDNLKEKINDLGNEKNKKKVRDTTDRAKNALESLFDLVVDVLGLILRFALRIIGFFLAFIGIMMLIGFIGMLLGFPNMMINMESHRLTGFDFYEVLAVIFNSPSHYIFSMIGLVLFIGIPLVALILFGIRVLFRTEPIPSIFNRGMSILWGFSIILIILSGVMMFKSFEMKGVHTIREYVPSTEEAIDVRLIMDDIYEIIDDDQEVYIDEDRERLYLGDVEFDIRESESDGNYLEVRYSSNGSTRKKARELAQSMDYPMNVDSGSIELANYFSVDTENKWRAQEVEIVLYLEEGQRVFLNEEMIEIIYDIRNVHRMWDSDMVDHEWIMGVKGLECTDCLIKKKDEQDELNEEDWWEENDSTDQTI
jgi:phage shock protein PspC (stress-responsive transcriptional regulator)